MAETLTVRLALALDLQSGEPFTPVWQHGHDRAMAIRPGINNDVSYVRESVVVDLIVDHNGLRESNASYYLGMGANPAAVLNYVR